MKLLEDCQYIYINIDLLKKNTQTKYFGLELIYNKGNIQPKDKPYKILVLIIFSSFFDLVKNILNAYHLVRRNKKNSILFNSRVGCITTIMSCLLCIYSFKFKLGKHHKMSLVIMSACVIIEIFLEIYNKSKEILILPFLKDRLILFLGLIFTSFTDCLEKYLVELILLILLN